MDTETVEETSLVVPTVVTPTHNRLADKFIEGAIDLLRGQFKVKKYFVESDYFETEVIELEFDEKTKMTLSVRRNS